MVLIEGEAGIGKTRLVDEFIGLLQQEGEELNLLFAPTRRAASPPRPARSPPPTGAVRKRGSRDHARALPLSNATARPGLRRPAARGRATPRRRAAHQGLVQTVFVHATRALAAERPTVVVIDDLHFAPEGTGAVSRPRPRRTRPPPPPRRHRAARPARSLDRKRDPQRPRLARRSPATRAADLSLLLADVFRSERLAEELALQIATKSDGNPFFVIEIVRELRAGESSPRSPTGPGCERATSGDPIPSSVMDLIRARIAELEEEDRELLDVAACWGFEFDPTLVAAALGMEVLPALRRFGLIERRERLVRSAGRRYVFDHHQVQEALYAGLFEPLREQYHAALAAALEAREGAAEKDPKELNGGVAVALCEHFLRAGMGSGRFATWTAALDDLKEAIRMPPLWRSQTGRSRSMISCAVQERVRVLLHKEDRLMMIARPEKAPSTLDEALGLADATGDLVLRAKVRNRLGSRLRQVARFEEARRSSETPSTWHARRGRAHRRGRHRKPGNCPARSRAIRGSEGSMRSLPRPNQAIGDRRREAIAVGNLGNVLYDLGRYAEALYLQREGRALDREAGMRRGEAMSLVNLGNVLGVLGREDEGFNIRSTASPSPARDWGPRLGVTGTAEPGVSFANSRRPRAGARGIHRCVPRVWKPRTAVWKARRAWRALLLVRSRPGKWKLRKPSTARR